MENIETISRIIMFVSFYTIGICFFIYLFVSNVRYNKATKKYWELEFENQKEIHKERLKYIKEVQNLTLKEMQDDIKNKPKRGRKKNV